MPGLLDIAPLEIATEIVTVRGVDLVVRGLDAADIAKLLKRFPAIAHLSMGRTVDQAETLVTSIESMPAMIAAALGQGGDENTEIEIRRRLTNEDMKTVLEVVIRLTNPPVPSGPFVPPNGAAAVASGKARASR